MDTKIAYCGITCSECGTFMTTRSNDYGRKVKSAEYWTKKLGYPIRPEDIHCDGCLSEGRLMRFCATCTIRRCAQERKVVSCAYCSNYCCNELEKIHGEEPEARAKLEEIQKSFQELKGHS